MFNSREESIQDLESSTMPALEPALDPVEWVSACDMTDTSVEELESKIQDAVEKLENGDIPVALVDLDGCAFLNESRTCAIFRDWAAQNSGELARAITDNLTTQNTRYGIVDTLANVGIDATDPKYAAEMKSLREFWHDKFLSNEYLDRDIPNPGAAAFFERLYNSGVEIIYYTGRPEPEMLTGTEKSLRDGDFPYDRPGSDLVMKPNTSVKDLEFKSSATDYIPEGRVVVAVFENEPENVVTLLEQFPESMIVFVESGFSSRKARKVEGLYRLANFS